MRVESRNDQLPVRNQYPLDFAQNLMRVAVKFEDVWHQDKIDAVRCEGQFSQIAKYVNLARFAGNLAQRDAVLREQIELWQPELQRVVAEHINNQRVNPGLFPGHDVASLWRVQPGIDPGN